MITKKDIKNLIVESSVHLIVFSILTLYLTFKFSTLNYLYCYSLFLTIISIIFLESNKIRYRLQELKK